MIPEIGVFSLVLALCLCAFQLICGLARGSAGTLLSSRIVQRLSGVIFACVLISFLTLMVSYIRSDFSVRAVVDNSYTAESLIYKIAATWGNHEGSMLLWLLVLTGFGCFASLSLSPREPSRFYAVLAQSALALGTILYILLTSNPFARVFPPPSNGDELNPLLQDIGLALHPPLLYLGYVGFSMVYSFAIGGLITGHIGSAWAKRIHPWILTAWIPLTLGIGMGSWWAYRELGWGGFWFWDPVENISLMPWLAATALLHSNMALMRRGLFGRWTVLLAIITFSLSLMGTFLVRSGLLTSVHSFASDPARGLFILVYITLATGGALLLFAWRGPELKPTPIVPKIFSREGFMLFNNILLVAACATVSLGTLYPLILQSLGLSSLSIGGPYYDSTVLPLLAIALLGAGIAPLLPWGKTPTRGFQKSLSWLMLGTGSVFVLGYAMAWKEALFSAAVMGLAAWTATGGILAWLRASRNLKEISAVPFSTHGMMLSHLGVGMIVAALGGTSLWTLQADQLLHPSGSITVGAYDFIFDEKQLIVNPNYTAQIIPVTVNGDEKLLLYPEIRHYPVRDSFTTEAAIHTTAFYDIYIALGRALEGDALSVRIYIRPLMLWLWAGVAFTALGGMVAWIDRIRKRAP